MPGQLIQLSNGLLDSAQVMISRFVRSSPTLGSTSRACLGFSNSRSLPLPHSCSLLSQNKYINFKKKQTKKPEFTVLWNWKVQGMYRVQVRPDTSAKTMMTLSLSIFFWGNDDANNSRISFYQYTLSQQWKSTLPYDSGESPGAGPHCFESFVAKLWNRLIDQHRVMCPSLTQGHPGRRGPGSPKQ